MAFSHAQVIHSIEQVGLAHAVQSGNKVQPGGEFHCLIFVVFEIGEFQLVQVHYAKVDVLKIFGYSKVTNNETMQSVCFDKIF
jgi:hypothetical protein